MIHNTVIIYILMVHFLADFCLQTNDQATMKSTNIPHLFKHVLTYSIVWFFASYVLLSSWLLAVVFASVTFVAHFITDYITSRIGKPLWESKDLHNGFVMVGADQVFHYVQLIFTYELLS